MTDQSSTSNPPTFDLFGNVISSPESAAGPTPLASLAGPATAKSGPRPFHVSRFRSLDSEKEMPTNATSGPLFTASSPSAALQGLLESRLRAFMDVNGSPEFALTWRQVDMPAGPPLCRLAPSGRHTAGSGSSGAPWNTPTLDTSQRTKRYSQGGHALSLQAAWPTPMAGTPAQKGYNEAGNNDFSRKVVEIASAWSTPTARDANTIAKVTRGAGSLAKGNQIIEPLVIQAAAWATPKPRDWRSARGTPEWKTRRNAHGKGLEEQTFGTAPSGASAPTEKPGALNPEFVCWLMGYPTAWDACAATATPSSRKSRRRS